MGVFLTYPSTILRDTGLPHVRGGVSTHQGVGVPHPVSSPRAWGCFQEEHTRSRITKVFPTCVGVFPGTWDAVDFDCCLPHVRGGVSDSMEEALKTDRSSPRAWGCFLGYRIHTDAVKVFPTCVGVFPSVGKP